MTNPLYRNDRPGKFPDSWYAATAEIPPQRQQLRGDITADVCIVGAGFTGLMAALELAEAGMSVVVLDAQRAGWGASGRNGGQVGSGFNKDQRWISSKLGKGPAKALWDMTEEAKDLLKARVEKHAPEARFRPGVAHGAYNAVEARELRDDVEYLKCSDEHGVVGDPNGVLNINDKLRLVPGHCDPTCNVHDWYVGVRNGKVETVWPVSARGKAY